MRKAITSKRRIKLLTEAIKSARQASSCHCQGIDEGKGLDCLDAMRKLHMAWKPSTEEGELYKQQLGDAISSVKTGDDIGEGRWSSMKDRFVDQDRESFDVGAAIGFKRGSKTWQGRVVGVKKKSGSLHAVVALDGGKKKTLSPDEIKAYVWLVQHQNEPEIEDQYSVIGDVGYDHRPRKRQYPRDDPDW